ncbi:MAG: tetratricopeptide repeat protein [Pirellulales bacterium]|nr:tetratricopeptide repeat protein [Pirellulales bacterium]
MRKRVDRLRAGAAPVAAAPAVRATRAGRPSRRLEVAPGMRSTRLLAGAILVAGILTFVVAGWTWLGGETPQKAQRPPVAVQRGILRPMPSAGEPKLASNVPLTDPPAHPPADLPADSPVDPLEEVLVEPPTELSEALPPTLDTVPARQLAAQGLKEEVAELTTGLLEAFPNDADAWATVGKIAQGLGNSGEAMEHWQRCLQLAPNRADIYSELGMIALCKGECEKAEALWRKALEIQPTMPSLYNRLARALTGQGKPREAIAALRKDIEISPDAGESHFLLGQAYLQLEEHLSAKQAYQRAVEIDPEMTNAYYGLATVCARLGERDQSREHHAKFAELKAEDRHVLKQGKVAFDDLLALRITVAQGYTDAGRVCRRHNLLWRAEKHWKRAAELDVKNIGCRQELAALCLANRREPEALSIYEQLAQLEPNNPSHYLNAGICSARLRQDATAEKAFARSIELAPHSALAHGGLAQVYLRANRNLAEARALAQKAVELEPIAPNYMLLAQACDKTGDLRTALSAMEKAVELEPGNPHYKRIVETIRRRL